MPSITTTKRTAYTPSPLVCWGAGDSITDAVYVPHDGNTTWGVISAGLSGTGWIVTASGYTIQTVYNYTRTFYGFNPKTLVVMGGVNDIRHLSLTGSGVNYTAAQLIPYIINFTAARLNDGIRVIHCTQPYWTHVYTSSSENAEMAALNAWLLATYPDTIDGDGVFAHNSTYSTDGLHPNITGSPKPSQTLSNFIRDAVTPA